jgi:thiol-disulfide isomerase/thioredoxin
MRKVLPPLIVCAVLAASVAAQSGRKIKAAPPRTEPPIQAPSAAQPEERPTVVTPDSPTELSTLPESVLKRKLQSLDKGSFRLSDFAGSVVVVNLWATWCGPCRMEVPEYEDVRREYAGRHVEFIGLTTEDPRTSSDRVKQFVRDFNFGFRLGWADRETALTLMRGRNTIPQTLVIAPDGRIISHWRGYSRGHSAERLRQALERALSVGEEKSGSTQP